MPQPAMQSVVGNEAARLDVRTTSATAASVGFRDVVAFLDRRSDNSGIAEFAAALASEHAARLIAVFIVPEPDLEPSETFARGAAIAALIDRQAAGLRGMAAERRILVQRVAHRHGIEAEWRVVAPFAHDDAIVHARHGDLAVMARSEVADQRWGDRRLLEALIRTSGRPVIVLPPQGPPSRVRRVLLAWNGAREAARAAADAMPLLANADAVEVLSVGPEPGAAAHGALPGADIARHLARHGAKVAVRHVTSNGEGVGQVLLAQARAFEADLVVMGAFGRSPLREHVFGGATHTVLRQATLPVLFSC